MTKDEMVLTIKRIWARYPYAVKWDDFIGHWKECLPIIQKALAKIDIGAKRVIYISKDRYTSFSIIFAYLLKTELKHSVYVNTLQHEVDKLDKSKFSNMDICDYNLFIVSKNEQVPSNNFYDDAYKNCYSSWMTFTDNFNLSLIFLCANKNWLVKELGLRIGEFTVIDINEDESKQGIKTFRGDIL